MQEKIIILDFGSQTTQLIGRRIRELNIYSEIIPYNKYPYGQEAEQDIIGVILSGSPLSVYDEGAYKVDIPAIAAAVPVLGICYGAQLMSLSYGGKVEPAPSREYGRANLNYVDSACTLFEGIEPGAQVWMSHGDTITALPESFRRVASTAEVHLAAFEAGPRMWGVQFHPEVYHSECGMRLLENFAVRVCGAKCSWSAQSFIESTVAELKATLSDDRVILGLSGGVDSSVAAVLLNRAIGDRLTCIFVDHGMLRKNEFADVLRDYQCLGLNVIGVDASEKFFADLAGVTDPERKRKIIGADFIEVFDAEAAKITDARWLAQGTIYPDCIESLSITGTVIKSHHKRGRPTRAHEPAPVRAAPTALQRRSACRGPCFRHARAPHLAPPLPRPGSRRAHPRRCYPRESGCTSGSRPHIHTGLRDSGLYNQVWQAGVILLPVQSVGVMGDERTYERAVALRAVTSTDAMTADWAHLPYDFLAKVSNDIIRRVRGVNRVCYDVSSKPPATIEWE